MALPTLATAAALADWVGEAAFAGADERRATGALRMASALVRRETGKDWTDPANPAALINPVPEPVEVVTLQAAARAYVNPEFLTGDRIDDGQVFRKLDEAGLYLTASEKDLLAPLSGRAFGGLGTVSTTRGESMPSDLRDDWAEAESRSGLPWLGEPRW